MCLNQSPKVSVVMAAYNAEKYIQAAINSILIQTFTDFEFIIIDDGSQDDTYALITAYTDPRIRIIKNETNLGITLSLNKGLKIAKGIYIARQDADDISYPTRLEKQVAFLDENAEVGFVGGSWNVMDANGKYLSTKRVITDNSHLLLDQVFVEVVINHGVAMFRQAAIERVGGYRPEAGNAEDLDLWVRIGEHFQLVNLSEPLCATRVHDESIVGGSLKIHLESVYKVRQLALDRWAETGQVPVKKTTIARCYLLMACQDFALGRLTQGRNHLLAAQKADSALPEKHDCESEIAVYAMWACKMSNPTGDVGSWSRVGKTYIDSVVGHIPPGWSFSARRIYAHFMVIAAFYSYSRKQFSRALQYVFSGVRNDLHWAKNRGLWRVLSGSLVGHRVIF